MALASGGTVSLLQSSDGVRWAPAPGFTPGPGSAPAPVRRGSTLYLYDSASVSGSALRGTLRRFSVGSGGRLTEREASFYEVQLASPEDAQRASAGTFPPSVALEETGALVFVYALRFEPETNACPVSGQACLKIRTATETAGSDGAAFVGDAGNRFVLGFDPLTEVGPPSLLRASTGWAALFQGPGACLHVLTATDPHKQYRNGGCATSRGPASPSGLWDRRLREYRLYGLAGGAGGSSRQRAADADRSRAVPAAGARRGASFARVVANVP